MSTYVGALDDDEALGNARIEAALREPTAMDAPSATDAPVALIRAREGRPRSGWPSAV